MMEAEDIIQLHAPSGSESENNDVGESNEPEVDLEPTPEVKTKQDVESQEHLEVDTGIEEGQFVEDMNLEDDQVEPQPVSQEECDINASASVDISSKLHIANGFITAEEETIVSTHKNDESYIVGVKRSRMTFEEHNPSVHVTYNSLTRKSKRKLEELLLQWSEWHADHASSQDPDDVQESGEETYFPALQTGLDKSKAVSFWMDSQSRKEQGKEVVSVDAESVPLYDRGFALGLTLEDASGNSERSGLVEDAARCFNCGSYSHALKDCIKPRDNVAVSNARKQHMTKRNQNAGSRNPTRYYQDSPGGKFDGLRPGSLDVETRKLLGIGELDPPPWLNRMRELGYPPGYLECEDQPSGITIYSDAEPKKGEEDGEILETQCPEANKKKSVDFPGINAPIPENADEKRWAAGASDLDRNRSHSRGHYYEQRGPRDFRDDGPPGVDIAASPLISSSYPPRYGDYDSRYSPYNSGNYRSLSDRVRRSPLHHEGFQSHDSNSYASSPSSLFSPPRYGSPVYDYRKSPRSPERRYEVKPDHSSYNRSDSRHRHSRR